MRRPLGRQLADFVDAIDALAEEFLVLPAVFENVPEHAVDRGDMRAGTHADIFGRMRRRPRHARVDHDHVGAVEFLAFENMLKRDRMRLRRIAAHQQDGLGVADVVVAVRHRAIAPGVGDPGDGGGMADARLMIGIVGSPEGGEFAVEVGGFVGEFGRAQPVHRVRSRLLANVEKLVADLVDRRFPGNADPLAVHELHRVAQAALAQHVIAHRRTLAAMRSTVDRAVVVGLLADPHAVRDLGDHRATDRAMGADVLSGGDGRPGRRRRTGLRLADRAERQSCRAPRARLPRGPSASGKFGDRDRRVNRSPLCRQHFPRPRRRSDFLISTDGSVIEPDRS